MITGTSKAHFAFHVAVNTSLKTNVSAPSCGLYPRFFDIRYAVSSSAIPIRTPGMIPAMNIAPTDTLPTAPYTTNGMEGGMMTPMEPAAAVTPEENPLAYLLAIIAGIMKLPMAATVAGPDPAIAAKNIQATIVTSDRPPVIQPTSAVARSKSRFEIPPRPINIPARIKNGIANRENESNDVNAFWAIRSIGRSVPNQMATMA